MTTAPPPDKVQDAVHELQRRVWSRADDPRFVLTVYEPLRQGWKIGSVGGLELLDYAGAYAGLGPEHHALEFGAGMGDACVYIATHFGAHVTGVEIVPEQIARARERHGSHKHNVELVLADILQWEPPRRYDAVYFLEVLALFHDYRALLEKLHGALRPGGALVMSDFVAGPGLRDEDRDFLWKEDGIVHNLPTQEERLAVLRDVGFQGLEVMDITAKALAQQERIREESERHQAAIVEGVGIDSWENWVECADVYGRFFAERKLLCTRVGARRS